MYKTITKSYVGFSIVGICVAACMVIVIKSRYDYQDPVALFRHARAAVDTKQITDRNGIPLNVSYQGQWNTSATLPIYNIPEELKNIFVIAEDHRYFNHFGVDWRARVGALFSIFNGTTTPRGASTITEQVIRMLHPRARSLWSKWIEGWEAYTLEQNVDKIEILEFYLNQIPYAGQRRGVVQAARYYFARSLDTLSLKEMLALAILVRAPSRFDLKKHVFSIEGSIIRLAKKLYHKGVITEEQIASLVGQKLKLSPSENLVNAAHFIEYVRAKEYNRSKDEKKIQTTLDSTLQRTVTKLLKSRLNQLASMDLKHGAVVVADHISGEVLAWASLGVSCESAPLASGCAIDMVQRARQPGSALKAFLYGAALQKGWSPVTLINDEPYANTVGNGLHNYRNYSRSHYGTVTLRQALGNSLNIPAVHTIEYVGVQEYFDLLKRLGFNSLNKSARFYDEGLALGSGEVTLFELVQAYQTLANKGIFKPLSVTLRDEQVRHPDRIYSQEVASLVGNILSDHWARALEFGSASVLNFPNQTAVKTGTSTDYRDSWAVGYSNKYVVGIWMGNVDGQPTKGVTGSIGPALLLRSIFNQLNQNSDPKPLYLSPKLTPQNVCVTVNGSVVPSDLNCTAYTEYFLGTPSEVALPLKKPGAEIRLARPAPGLMMAFDPRVPAEHQRFEMHITGVSPNDEVEWIIDGKSNSRLRSDKFLWPIVRGHHTARGEVFRDGVLVAKTEEHGYLVR
jgi:penicillin-binding protein 1C